MRKATGKSDKLKNKKENYLNVYLIFDNYLQTRKFT